MDIENLKISKPGIIPVSLWNDAMDAIGSVAITSFRGGGFFRSKGGTTLFSRQGLGGEASAFTHPFQVTTRKKESGGGYEAMVNLESSLYKSLRPNDKQTITGLDAWFDLIGNDAIWLGIVFDETGSITYAGIDSWGQGDDFDLTQDAWSGENGYCEDDGDAENPQHQTSRKLLAYSVAGSEGEPVLTQVVFHDQVLFDWIFTARPARYPFDFSGGYPI